MAVFRQRLIAHARFRCCLGLAVITRLWRVQFQSSSPQFVLGTCARLSSKTIRIWGLTTNSELLQQNSQNLGAKPKFIAGNKQFSTINASCFPHVQRLIDYISPA
jgi:hypothetical protein